MANKRGAGTEPISMADAGGKQSGPRKGARGAGDTKATRTTRSTKAGAGAAETGSAGKGTSGRGTAKGSGNGRTRRSATSGAGAGTRARAGVTRGPADLKKDLRDFAGARPDGWSHDDWLRFLDDLQSRGHNINDRDAIGSMLERERLALALERIPGVGPQRVKSIADKYGYLWRLRETDADQLAREANVPKAIAEKVLNGLRH